MNNEFILNIIAQLNKHLSKKSIDSDLKTLNNTMYVKVIAKLSQTLSKRQLKKQLKELNDLYVQVGASIKLDKDTKNKLQQNIKDLQKSMSDIEIGLKTSKLQESKINAQIQAVRSGIQKKVQNTPIEFNLEIRKNKLISDIEYLGKRYSKLFSNASASENYEKLMSNAFNVSDKVELSNVRAELAAFTSELKANGLAAKSTGDKWKSLLERSKELFSAATAVRVIFSQIKQAVSTFLELDTALTDLYKVQNDIASRDQFSSVLSKWNKLAQGLAVTTKSLINSASEWSKIGFNLDMSKQLSQITAIFEKTAEISNEQASKTLISGAQAFTEIDDLGEDDYVKRVEAIGNKVNAIGNKYAISSEGIAEALQNSSAALKMANNDLDESIALITAGNKIFQSPEEMGNTLKVVSARLRGQKGELEALNEDTEGMIEGVSKVQTQILNLSHNKVNIFEDDNETLKSTYEIMLEVGKVLDNLSDKDSASLLEIMFGKQRMSAGASILLNYKELEKVKNDSINAGNSMAEEYSKYLESAEAHLTTFKEKLVETYSVFMSGDMIKFAADTGSSILDIVNKTDLLRHSLLAIATINIGKGITALGAGIASTVMQMNTLGGAIQKVNSLSSDNALRKATLKELGDATKGLTDKNLKLLLSQKQLTAQEKIAILSQHNLTEEEIRAKIEKMGLISATNSQTTANTANTTSTFTLSGALTALKASAIGAGQAIKAAFLSNPIGFVLMGATTAVSVLTTAISNHNQKVEDARQKNIEAAKSIAEEATELSNLYIQYEKLNNIQDKTSSQEEEFKTAVENITRALGEKASALDGLTAGTDEYTQALKNATKAELEGQYASAKMGAKAAEDNLRDKTWNNWSGSQISIGLDERMTGNKTHMEALDEVRSILSDYEDRGAHGLEWEPVNWDENNQDMEAVIDYYNALLEARNKLVTSDNADTLMKSDIYENINTTINSLSESIEEYTKQKYEALKLEYLWQNGIPVTETEFKNMEQTILGAGNAGQYFQDVLKGYLSQDFSSLSNNVDSVADSYNSVAEAQNNVKNSALNSNLSNFAPTEGQSKSIDDFQSKISTLQSALEKLNSGKLTDSDFVDLIQQFPELANNSGNLGTAIQTLGQKLKDDLLASLGESPTALTDSIESMADKLFDATGGVETLGEAIGNLQESQNMMNSLNENIANNGTITTDMINTILAKYPQMTDVLSDYLMNLATQEDVIQALQGVYDTDLKNYQKLCIGKQAYDTEFYNSVLAKLPKWVSELANSYGIDLKNFKSLAEAKAKVEEALIRASQDLWKRYYDRYYAAAQRTNSTTSESEMIQNEKFARNALNKQKDGEKILSALDDLSIDMSGIQAPQFSASSGSGGSKSGSKSKKAKESKEEINWADRKLEILGKRLDIIKKKASEIASVFKNQNKLLNNAVQNLKRQIEVQKKAKKTYLEKAGKVKLSSSLKKKVRDGSISISSYDSKTAEKIKEYQEWYDAAKDVDSIITQLTLDIKELKKQKIDNIIDDFDRKKSYQESLIDYRETKIGDTGKTSDYNYLIKKTNTVKENLQKEYNEIKKRFDAMVKAGLIDKYDDDWFEYKELLVNLKVEMEECTESVMEYKKAIMQLRFDKFDKAVETLSNLSSEFSNIQRLLSDNFFNGTALTKDGMANLTLNFQGIANAKKSLETYAKGIAGLKKNLKNGNITQEEYNEKLSEYKAAQKEASLAIKDYRDAIINMAVSSINAETEAMRKLIEEKKEALQAEKDLHDYRNSIAEKEQDIAVLQAKIAELSKSSDRKDIALRLELEADLAEAQKDLSETQYDHDMELKQDALDEELENYEKAQDEKIKQLESNLDAQEKVLNDYLKQVQNNYSSTMTYITSHAATFSYNLTDFLSDPWDTGMQKAKSYQELIDSIVSDTGLSGGKINTNQSGSSSGGSGSNSSGSSSTNSGSNGSGSSNYKPGGFGGTMTNIGMEASTPDSDKVSKVSGDIKYGNSGTKVTVLQKALKTLGFNPGKTDGKYGADTLAAAKSFQKNTTKVDGGKLPADGVIESKTKKKFKLNGFKKGVRDLGKDQLAEVNEEGQETIIKPKDGVVFPLEKHDTVLNAKQTDNLIKNSKIDVKAALQNVPNDDENMVIFKPNRTTQTLQTLHQRQLNALNPGGLSRQSTEMHFSKLLVPDMPKIETKAGPAVTQNIDASIHVTGVTRDEINKFIEKAQKDSFNHVGKAMRKALHITV